MDLAKLNSATKYPGIETYHEMGDRGRLNDIVRVPFPAGEALQITEKVDGTNGRIVVLPNGPRRYLIGSREEFLFAQGDLVWNTTYDIKTVLEPIAETLPEAPGDAALVWFFEVYGTGLPGAKQYTEKGVKGARLFDIARVPLSILEQPIEQIASWRDHGGQDFLPPMSGVQELILPLQAVKRVPAWFTKPIAGFEPPPVSLKDTLQWLTQFSISRVHLDEGQGRAEGVVVRTADRKAIAKMRFEDYERTLGVKRK